MRARINIRARENAAKYVLREDLNVMPLSVFVSNGFVSSVDTNAEDLKAGYPIYRGNIFKGVNNPLMYSLSVIRNHSNWLSTMSYTSLLAGFTGRYAAMVFKKSGSDTVVSSFNGMITEKVHGKIKILVCVVIKKEWMVDVAYRTTFNIPINPDCFGLLVDNGFDKKDYHYKGLRSMYRKEIKPEFEGKMLEVDDIFSLLIEEVKTPSFITKDQKSLWEKEMMTKFSKNEKVRFKHMESIIQKDLPF